MTILIKMALNLSNDFIIHHFVFHFASIFASPFFFSPFTCNFLNSIFISWFFVTSTSHSGQAVSLVETTQWRHVLLVLADILPTRLKNEERFWIYTKLIILFSIPPSIWHHRPNHYRIVNIYLHYLKGGQVERQKCKDNFVGVRYLTPPLKLATLNGA